MRLFVAADLSSEQIDLLREKVAEAKSAAPFEYIRWIPETNWHATLAFLGDRLESDIEQVEARVDTCVRVAHSLTVRPRRIQAFPHRSQPRLLALKADPEQAVQQLYFQLGQAFAIKDRQRDFRFHVTVARFRDLVDESAKLLNESIRNLTLVGDSTWIIPHVTLYESTLRQGGAEYRKIRSWAVPVP